jgi:16S rRNA (guanine527-N7)-methyltransferase
MKGFTDKCGAMGVKLDSAQISKLDDYLTLLHKWNKAINLSAIRELDKMRTHHLLDSLSIIPYINGDKILDIGSGGGLPGIPIAVSMPDAAITLLDSRSKKTRFLEFAKMSLKLSNTQVVQKRLEEFYADGLFDVIVVRAVGPIEELLPDCQRLAQKNARLIYMTGVKPADMPEHSELIKLDVPGLDAQRHLIIVQLNPTN